MCSFGDIHCLYVHSLASFVLSLITLIEEPSPAQPSPLIAYTPVQSSDCTAIFSDFAISGYNSVNLQTNQIAFLFADWLVPWTLC